MRFENFGSEKLESNNLITQFPDYTGLQEEYSLYMERVRDWNAHFGGTEKFFVRTYGCIQNVAESEKIKGFFVDMGFVLCADIHDANIIIFNTCAIREHAENRVFGNIGEIKHLKEKNPNLMIILCGCMTQQSHIARKIRQIYPFVDLIFGTNFYKTLPKILYRKITDQSNFHYVAECSPCTDLNDNIRVLRDSKIHANVPIMFGCENFCSYCIVPYVKGPERSRDFDVIVAEVKNLIENGYKKITLLGQNVNSYGKGLNTDFASLLEALDDIDGDFWIDFMSSHPKDLSKEIIDVIADSRHICNHIHLPFQSGSNKILNLMNRKYSREKYLDIINYAKQKVADLNLTSDVIVGFPGETESDFQETISLVREVKFSTLFTFIYSKRAGTRAEKFPDPTSKIEKTNRLTSLIEIQKNISDEIHKNYIGKRLKVLIYRDSINEKNYIKTRNNLNVEVPEFTSKENFGTQKALDFFGKFATIEVTGYKNSALIGNLIETS